MNAIEGIFRIEFSIRKERTIEINENDSFTIRKITDILVHGSYPFIHLNTTTAT